jgi:prevent-host-death family protein
MNTATLAETKTVGTYEAKTHLPELLDWVASGREVTITRHSRAVARLVPANPKVNHSVFARLRALRTRLVLPAGETTRDLISAGRRI